MRDKQYQFNLTEKQVDMINELIKKKFQIASDTNGTVNDAEELMILSSNLNFELGIYKGVEEFERWKNDNQRS